MSTRAALAFALTSLLAAGCLYIPPDPATAPASTQALPSKFDRPPEGMISVSQLSELVQGFADRYYALVSSAGDELVRNSMTSEERLFIDQFQSRTITAVYDIATNPDPFSQLLDLVVVVSLTTKVMNEEAVAEEALGSPEQAQRLKKPLQQAYEEIWNIAARAMTQDQLETLERLIRDWRVDHDDTDNVSFVRFDQFASSRGKSTIADVPSGTGLLAPVDDAKKAVDEARLFGERVFYMAKRIPLLVSVESSHLLSQIAAKPEVKHLTELADRVAASSERIKEVADQLPTTIDETSASLRSTLQEYDTSITKTNELVTNLRGLTESLKATVDAAERVTKPFAPTPESEARKPVDPEVYARMLADVKDSLIEVNKALDGTRTLAESSAWQRPIDAADDIARKRVEQAGGELRSLVDVVFQRSLILVGVVFSLLFLYRAWTMHMRKHVRMPNESNS